MRKGLNPLIESLVNSGYSDSNVVVYEFNEFLILEADGNILFALDPEKGYKPENSNMMSLARAYLKSVHSILRGLPFSVKRIRFTMRDWCKGTLSDSEEKGALEINLF